MAKDREYQQLIHTARWLKLRRDTLTAHPCCQRCQQRGEITAATEVHHVRPVEDAFSRAERAQRMYDPHNLLALCHDCHVQAHVELGRSGKAATAKRNAEHVAAVVKKFFADGADKDTGGTFLDGGTPR